MRILRSTGGSALIEVSLIGPVLIVMMLGVMDLGIVLRGSIAVADSARAGAECGLLSGSEAATSSWVSTATYSAGAVPGYAATARSFCTCGAGGSTVSCSGSCAGVTMAQYAEVTATANLPLAFTVRGLPASFPVKTVCRIRTKFTSGK